MSNQHFTTLVQEAAQAQPVLGQYLPMVLSAANSEDDFQNAVLAVMEVIKAPLAGDRPESSRVAYAVREAMTGRRLARQDEKAPVLPNNLRDEAAVGIVNFSDLVNDQDEDDEEGGDALDAVLSLVSDEAFTVDEAVVALSRPTDELLRRMALKGLCARSTCGWAHALYLSFVENTVVFVGEGMTAGEVDEKAILAYADRQSARRKAERQQEMAQNPGNTGFYADPADEANEIEEAFIDHWGMPEDAEGQFDHPAWETLEMTFSRAYKVVVPTTCDSLLGEVMSTSVEWIEGEEYEPSADVSDTDELDRMIAEIRGISLDHMLSVDLAEELPLFEKPSPEVLAKQWAWMEKQLHRPPDSGYRYNPKFQVAKCKAILAGHNGDEANALAFVAAYRTGKEPKLPTDARHVGKMGISTKDGRVLTWTEALKAWDLIQAPDLSLLAQHVRAASPNKDALRLASLIEHIRLAV